MAVAFRRCSAGDFGLAGGFLAFSFYLQNFADYNATYGTLGAVIGFMMWTWISVIILLVGAELNAELEHQTSTDWVAAASGVPGRANGGYSWKGGWRLNCSGDGRGLQFGC